MNQTVYVAALAGQTARPDGAELLNQLVIDSGAGSVLEDHATCYPTIEPAPGVLEPLYPDRLAEDFLALSLPGHDADYPAQPWASPAAQRMLHDPNVATASARTRAITFLAAGAARWPHLRDAHVCPAISREPALVLEAGNAALAAVATIPELSIQVLETLEERFPAEGDIDINAGMAAIMVRLTELRIALYVDDPLSRAESHKRCGFWLSRAGRYAESLSHEDAAAALCRSADPSVEDRLYLLGVILGNRAVSLSHLGRRDEAVASTEEAVDVRRELARDGAHARLADLAEALGNMAVHLGQVNRRQEAVGHVEEAVAILRRLAEQTSEYRVGLARVEMNLSHALSEVARWDDALSVALAGNLRWRNLADELPKAHRLNYARALANVGARFNDLQRYEEALPFIEKSVAIRREYLEADLVNPAEVSVALDTLSRCLVGLGRTDEAVVAAQEALGIDRQLAALDPLAYTPYVARALDELARRLDSAGRPHDAIAASREAVETRRRLASVNPDTFLPDLTGALHNLAMFQFRSGETHEAISASREVVGIRRELIDGAESGQNDFLEPDLAVALNNLAYYLVGIVRHDYPWRPLGLSRSLGERGVALLREAEALLEEAITRYTRLLRTHPDLKEHCSESADLLRGVRTRLRV